jgi:hypothetical protein
MKRLYSLASLLLSATLFCLTPVSFPQALPTSESWNNLKQLTHKRNLIFVRMDRSCIAGAINSVSDTAIVIKDLHGESVPIARGDLLRVSGADWGPSVLFSRRSSWSDLMAVASWLHRPLHPDVVVGNKSGKTQRGKLQTISETELVLESDHKALHITKGDISVVDYVTAKPLSSSAEYADGELAWMKIFDPELWPKLFGFQGVVNVRLFDASLPEDNSSIVCPNDPYLRGAKGLEVTKH